MSPQRAIEGVAAHQRAGRRAKRNGACGGRPRLEVQDCAALAFLTAVDFAGFGSASKAALLLLASLGAE